MPVPDAKFTLAAAKAHLRVTWNTEDAVITAMLDAAVARCEQVTNRAWCERTLTMMFSSQFAGHVVSCGLRLPITGFDDATEFKYRQIGEAAIDEPMPADTYRVVTDAYGNEFLQVDEWPADADIVGNFAKLVYTTIAEEVPPEIVQAAHLFLGDMFENREASIVGTILVANPASMALLTPHRVGLGV